MTFIPNHTTNYWSKIKKCKVLIFPAIFFFRFRLTTKKSWVVPLHSSSESGSKNCWASNSIRCVTWHFISSTKCMSTTDHQLHTQFFQSCQKQVKTSSPPPTAPLLRAFQGVFWKYFRDYESSGDPNTQGCHVFEWSKIGRMVNGLVFKYRLKTELMFGFRMECPVMG